MEIHQATYLQSAVSIHNLPADDKPEYAFAGRSNVGKSSLINYLCGREKLALTSSKPGKTKTINHFLIDETWYLVDLPGYGYAKSSKKNREEWLHMMRSYLLNRSNLVIVFILIDIGVSAMESDLAFIHLLGTNHIPFTIVFTKSDKLKQSEVQSNRESYEELLFENWSELPPMIISSTKKKKGKIPILEKIIEGNRVFAESRRPT